MKSATSREPNYKQMAYVDTRNYGDKLVVSNDTDEVVKRYLQGKVGWKEVTKAVATETKSTVNKRPRIRKGPWMKNRRDNQNTRKVRIYQFMQKSYEQNKNATITKIINGNFSLNNAEQTFPDIKNVEETYVNRLENGNAIDETNVKYPKEQHDLSYGRFTVDEVKLSLQELKRNSAARIDGITTVDLKRVPVGHITAIMNYWWGWIIPSEAEECRTTLLPKKDKDLDQVGNWQLITVGNMFMRLYAKLWHKMLRRNITLNERQKGFVPVDGCYENVKILQQVIKQQRKKRKEYCIPGPSKNF